MEPHPVPQNVTSFQFRLIGDMTIKQFAYLAAGLSIAYVTFITIYSYAPVLAVPIIVLSAGAGGAFAFFPINDRPLDHWVGSFIKAIMTPTKRRWEVKNVSVNDSAFNNRLVTYLATLQNPTLPITKTPKLDVSAQLAPQAVNMVAPTPQPPQNTTYTPKLDQRSAPQPEDLKGLVESAKEAQIIQTKIIQAEHELNLIKSQASTPGTDPTSYAGHFQEVLNKLQQLTKEANQIAQKMQNIHPPTQPPQKAKVEVIKVAKKSSIQFSLTAVPNIINGIVLDAQNNYLEGAIVVTHDKEGLPVRALRTNKLGQFIAATPLPNGTYILTVEKENLVFDDFNVELDGTVIQPIKITAKIGGGE